MKSSATSRRRWGRTRPISRGPTGAARWPPWSRSTRGGSRAPEPLTELGFARRLVDKHGEHLRYVVPWNRWLVWNGASWAPDADGHVQRCMKVIAREVHTALIRENKADPDMIRAAKRAESSSGVKGALTLAATEPEIAITPDRLDAHPYLLNCRNGVVDLQTGELLGHDPALLLTKMAGAPYEPDAEGAVFSGVPRAHPAERGHAAVHPAPARPLPRGQGDGPHPADLLRRRGEREEHAHRRGDERARRLRRRGRPRPAAGPDVRRPPDRRRRPVRAAPGARSTRPTPGTGWPRAPSSG